MAQFQNTKQYISKQKIHPRIDRQEEWNENNQKYRSKENAQYFSSEKIKGDQKFLKQGVSNKNFYPGKYDQQNNINLPVSNNGNLASQQQDPNVVIVKTRRERNWRDNEATIFYPGNTYIYPYYYNSSGCYYCCCWNGHCFPCQCCHTIPCNGCLCDALPCCNGCTGFHCGCLQCLPPCQIFNCVTQNNCDSINCLPCCSGCHFCANSCDGSCLNALPCCNQCQCGQLLEVIPCCNGCQCEHIFGCLPCCNDLICNVCGCLRDCDLFNCLNGCNLCDCIGNCNCGDCNCGDCNCGDCNCGDCNCGDCDCGAIGDCLGGICGALGDCFN